MTDFAPLDIDMIEAGLDTSLVANKILLYKATSSTNDVAWEYASNRDNNGLCIFAEQQHAGRGRRGNKWLSSPGAGILCSILLLDMDDAGEMLTLAAAVAVAETISERLGREAKIKWPNDIFLNGRKVAGLLVESRPGRGVVDYVLGIGINCHQDRAFFENAQLDNPATSLDIETNSTVDRNTLACDLLNTLDRRLNVMQTDTDSIIAGWKAAAGLLGHHVVVEHNRRRFAGNCTGIDPARGMVLQLDSGGVRAFPAAQTTILKQSTCP
ncbi:MAG: biotin--[acetyl-CoA-carboxylase] ligase [Planctomycetota bacterium]|nr:MAG: biotin--[acetyl-CoA-carboxylase] ligase [Planctomycetota bacterium]